MLQVECVQKYACTYVCMSFEIRIRIPRDILRGDLVVR
jgi:hypothetical protein